MIFNIIGGSGFVGSSLINEIGKEKCFNIDKNQSLFHSEITKIADIRNINNIKLSNNCSTVILLAAEHRDDVSPVKLYYDVNVEGTRNVLKVMDTCGVKNLIFLSSVAIYGLNKNNPNEKHPADPFNHYGKSKFEAESVIKEWFDDNPSEKSVTIIRPTVIFGERNRGNVYNLLKQISSGKFMMIGQGKNKKSMAYLGNVVAFINYVLRKSKPGYQIYNYADKPDFTMTDLVSVIESKMNIKVSKLKIPYWIGMLGGYFFDIIAKITNRKLSISSVRIKKFCATTQFDSSIAHNNFKAPFTLPQGIVKTLEHDFINHKDDEIVFFTE